MNYLFAIKSLSVVGGGAEKVLVEVANGLCRRGHVVGVLTFDFGGEAFYGLDEGVTRYDMGFNAPGHPTSLGNLARAIPRIRTVVRRHAPDVFIPFMHSTFVPLSLALTGMRYKTVFSEHVDYGHYSKKPMQYKLLKMAKRSVLATTVPSQAAMDTFPIADRKRMVVVPNPVRQMGLANEVSDQDDNGRIVLSVGRLMYEKDYPVLIDAFSMVANDFPNWVLKIVGEGDQRSTLEAQVSALGLQGRVKLPGATRDVLSEWHKASFAVVSSRYESFGMAAAEALMCAKPVLTFSECAGVAEMVEDGRNGVLVTGGGSHKSRKNALAVGLRRLMVDPDLCRQLGAAGPKSVAHYDLESVLDQWEALLAATLA